MRFGHRQDTIRFSGGPRWSKPLSGVIARLQHGHLKKTSFCFFLHFTLSFLLQSFVLHSLSVFLRDAVKNRNDVFSHEP
jgi:hypothetical protein